MTNLSGVPQRGALQILVTPSTRAIAAGARFSIAVNITNPYDVPIQIGSVTTVLPYDLYDDVLAIRLAERKEAERRLGKIREDLFRAWGVKPPPQVLVEEGSGSSAIRAAISVLGLPGLTDMVAGLGANTLSTAVAHAAGTKVINPDLGKKAVQWLAPPETREEEGLSPEQIQERVNTMLFPLQQEIADRFDLSREPPTLLQPGDSTTKVFVLRTRKGLTFRPSSYHLSILVTYSADSLTHSQTLPYDLDIQAPISSVIIGAVVGSVFGIAASNPGLFVFDWRPWVAILPNAIPVLILSAFGVIAFARKEGVQPIIAIQDFWGGLFIGFLVGYSGLEALGGIFNGVQPGGLPTVVPTTTPTALP